MKTSHVEIDLNHTGRGTVRLNGMDLSHALRGISIDAYVGDLTEVTIRIYATVSGTLTATVTEDVENNE